jgi:RimJ/RimL family protein N-acetyltransferase
MPDSFERQTSRLILRRWRDADREPFAAQSADPEVMRYFPATLDRAASDATVDRIRAHWERHGWGLWAAELRATGEFVGFLGLLVPRFPLPGNPGVEVGWRLGRAHWGHGYATEGARAALEMGFGPLGLPEIVAVTALGNQRSRAVMERLGMRDAGVEFDHPGVPEGNAVRRHCLYRIERGDWPDGPPELHDRSGPR